MADWNFYLAYNLFRLASITQGIAKRVVDGTAASEQARATGAATRHAGRIGLGVRSEGRMNGPGRRVHSSGAIASSSDRPCPATRCASRTAVSKRRMATSMSGR
jgi:hypothetical protein